MNNVGIALGGGGARGSYQIGIIIALIEEGLIEHVGHVSGTSIGAINTLMVMIEGKNEAKMLLELWRQIDNDELFGHGLTRYKKDAKGLYSTDGLFDKLSQELSEEKLRTSKIQGYATTAKLLKKDSFIDQLLVNHMEKKVFHLNTCEEPFKAALASASIPVIFGPTEINGEKFVDGGMLDNVPIGPLLEAGCDLVVAVPINGGFHKKNYEKENILLISLEPRFLFGKWPVINQISVVKFLPEEIEEKALYGYFMAKAMLGKLRKFHYIRKDGLHLPKKHTYVELTKEEEKAVQKKTHMLLADKERTLEQKLGLAE